MKFTKSSLLDVLLSSRNIGALREIGNDLLAYPSALQ
jgi:hypothetical protein